MANDRKKPASNPHDDGSGIYYLNSKLLPPKQNKNERETAIKQAVDLLQDKIKEMS